MTDIAIWFSGEGNDLKRNIWLMMARYIAEKPSGSDFFLMCNAVFSQDGRGFLPLTPTVLRATPLFSFIWSGSSTFCFDLPSVSLDQITCELLEGSSIAYVLTRVMASANSLFNPILYFMAVRGFRKTTKKHKQPDNGLPECANTALMTSLWHFTLPDSSKSKKPCSLWKSSMLEPCWNSVMVANHWHFFILKAIEVCIREY